MQTGNRAKCTFWLTVGPTIMPDRIRLQHCDTADEADNHQGMLTAVLGLPFAALNESSLVTVPEVPKPLKPRALKALR